MTTHICTFDSFAFEEPELRYHTAECHVCLQITQFTCGWVGMQCGLCGAVWDDESWLGSVAHDMRTRILKMTRRELGERLGYKPATIKRYEWVRCSQVYFSKLEEMVRAYDKTK